MNVDINWNNIINKEAKSLDDTYLGEIKDIACGFVIAQRESREEEKFCIPQNTIKSYDGNSVKFNISGEEAERICQV